MYTDRIPACSSPGFVSGFACRRQRRQPWTQNHSAGRSQSHGRHTSFHVEDFSYNVMRLLGLSGDLLGPRPVVRDAHIGSRSTRRCFAHFRVMVRSRTTVETDCIALQALLRCPARLREPLEGTPARVRPRDANNLTNLSYGTKCTQSKDNLSPVICTGLVF